MIPTTPIPALTTAYLSAYSAYNPSALMSNISAVNGSGGGGGGGGGYGNYWVTTSTSTNTSYVPLKSSYDDINTRLEAIEKRLCILQPDFKKHEKFSALESAYNNYLLLEKLCYEKET